jgi:hypothetical protein
MQSTDADYNGLLVRMARLERQSRFWKIAGVLMLLATVFSLTGSIGAQQSGANAPTPRWIAEYGQPASKLPTVEAQTFLLKDSAGYTRGKMTVDGDRHPLLEFYDLEGNVIWSTDSHVIPTK